MNRLALASATSLLCLASLAACRGSTDAPKTSEASPRASADPSKAAPKTDDPAAPQPKLAKADDAPKTSPTVAPSEAEQGRTTAEPVPDPTAASPEANDAASNEPAADDGSAPDQSPKPLVGGDAGVELGELHCATGIDGKTSIDITDAVESRDPKSDVDPVYALAEAHEHADGIERALPPEATLPKGFALGDEWAVATVDGEGKGKAIAFGATGGASESHFYVVLSGAHSGLAARASAWKGPVPTLRAVTPIDLKAGPGKALVAKIASGIVAAAEGDAVKVLRRRSVTADRLVVVAGHFPRGFTHLVTLLVPVGSGDDITEDHVAGMLLVDETGRVEPILAPHMTIDEYEVSYLVDLEGDGVDEVVYESRYYEGHYTRLMAFTPAGTVARRTLCGDGA